MTYFCCRWFNPVRCRCMVIIILGPLPVIRIHTKIRINMIHVWSERVLQGYAINLGSDLEGEMRR